jgi:tetrahydromethanopterin S-methyltransferase subunit F
MSSYPEAADRPIEDLERRALQERTLLHERATELKTKVQHVRQNLDLNRNARQYFGPAAAVLAGVGLLFGYVFAGLFTRH